MIIENQDVVANYFSDLTIKVKTLVSVEREQIFNCSADGLDTHSVIECLLQLYRGGLAYFFTESGKEVSCDKKKNLSFEWLVGLTSKGGERWESIFRPQWKQYVSVDEGAQLGEGPIGVQVQAGGEEILVYLLEKLGRHARLIDGGPARVSPWWSTYWKRLEFGYCAGFNVTSEGMDSLAKILSELEWRKHWSRAKDGMFVVR